MSPLLAAVLALLAGLAVGYFIDFIIKGKSHKTAAEILKDAEKKSEDLTRERDLQAKEELLKRREKLDKELDQFRDGVRNQERQLDKRENGLNEIEAGLKKRERMVEQQQQRFAEKGKFIETRERELERLLQEEQDELYKITGLNKQEAESRLLDRVDKQLKNETGALILKHQQELKTEQEKLAREIIGMAVQRYASTHTAETTVSTVDIPSDEMKGRIIGREGRNIRAFEKETGVDVIVDDTPGVVVVSAFDTVRREVAKISLNKLIQDGRIHPARIEEIVKETRKEMDDRIMHLGREAAEEAGVPGLHEKLLYLMGRLNFRVSYSQNVLRHSIEVAHLTGMMAEQLGLDADLARRCGFTHDIGKAADHEAEGGHPAIGADLLKRYGERAEVVHAAFGHHDDIRPEYIYTVLTAASDACSASRPGSRRETLEKYIRRLEELEAIACGFPGVNEVYAVQAGREVRVIVDPKQINDRAAAKMARDIAQAVEENMTYPGEVKVVVMREIRSVGVAK
ncbi:ribonuclease Y [Planctomicrobium piriforme]|uniref:Ribonuclease Y n=1 Tax=Planctomicrobium piriforme TaxID=1576369 RepID=A0A1I3PTP8_9PLAN|nr:ribonuclease Y [Planctomicrobium piriforme]SFJ24742.1 ribonucrease Y [Planctomicrobium piriforme]